MNNSINVVSATRMRIRIFSVSIPEKWIKKHGLSMMFYIVPVTRFTYLTALFHQVCKPLRCGALEGEDVSLEGMLFAIRATPDSKATLGLVVALVLFPLIAWHGGDCG